MQLRIAIWDVSDTVFDSTALIDGFQWLANATLPRDLELTVDRRTFLKRGLARGRAARARRRAASRCGPAQEIAAPRGQLQVLEPRAFQVLVAVAMRVVDAPGADPVQIAQNVDESLSFARARGAEGLQQAPDALRERPRRACSSTGASVPFTRLSGPAQDDVLRSWRDSSLALRRTGYHALRKICLAAHCDRRRRASAAAGLRAAHRAQRHGLRRLEVGVDS